MNSQRLLQQKYDPLVIVQEQPDGQWLETPQAELGASPGPWFKVEGEENIAHFRKFLRSVHQPSVAAAAAESSNQRYKLIFYVPGESLEKVKEGIFAAGGGAFPGGKYTHCSFESTGTGQFLPLAEKGANPTIGQLKDDGSNEYRIERVEEVRCEIMCVGRDIAKKSVEALKKAHPYQEPAYEVYKMEDF